MWLALSVVVAAADRSLVVGEGDCAAVPMVGTPLLPDGDGSATESDVAGGGALATSEADRRLAEIPLDAAGPPPLLPLLLLPDGGRGWMSRCWPMVAVV